MLVLNGRCYGFSCIQHLILLKIRPIFYPILSQDQLGRALFPLGDLTKADVRALAARFDLPTKDRKDSQGICFLGKLKFSDFIKYHVGEKEGDLVEYETGKKMGNIRAIGTTPLASGKAWAWLEGPGMSLQKVLKIIPFLFRATTIRRKKCVIHLE